MFFELATLLFVAAVLALLHAVGYLLLPAMRRREPALAYWGAANFAVVCAAVTGTLAAMRVIPIEVAGIIGPAAFLTGATLFYSGVRVFDRRPPLLGLHAAVVVTATILLTLLTFVQDSAQPRVVLISAGSVSYACVAVYTLLRQGDGGGGRWLLAGAWAGLAVFGVARAIVTLIDDPGRSVIDAAGVHAAAGLVLIVVIVLFNGAGLIMLAGRFNSALERLAHTDALTEALSRGAFLSRASRVLERSARDGTPAGIVVFDLDHFKAVNDRWGHPAGDAVLRAVAEAVRGTLRPADLFGRIGGEEFTVLLADTPATGVRVVAERLRRRIEMSEARTGRHALRVTASIGLAVAPTDGTTLEQLLLGADAALYVAKAAGRNRVCAAQGGAAGDEPLPDEGPAGGPDAPGASHPRASVPPT